MPLVVSNGYDVAIFVTPVFEIAPVDGLYPMPVPAERLLEEILLLKVDQSVDARKPLVLPFA